MSAYDETLKHLTNASLDSTETSRQFLRELIEVRAHIRSVERQLSEHDRRRTDENDALRRDMSDLGKAIDRVLTHVGESRESLSNIEGEVEKVKDHITGEHALIDPQKKSIADTTWGETFAAIKVYAPFAAKAFAWIAGLFAIVGGAVWRLIEWLQEGSQ